MKTFDEFTETCDSTWRGCPLGINEIPFLTLAINGEAGELAEHVKKMYRDDGIPAMGPSYARREAMLKELGDILFYLDRAARSLDSSLQTVAEINAAKLADRHQRGVIGGEGDNR